MQSRKKKNSKGSDNEKITIIPEEVISDIADKSNTDKNKWKDSSSEKRACKNNFFFK